MNEYKKQILLKICYLVLGFIVYGLIVRSMRNGDSTGGWVIVLMVLGGWVVFLYTLVKFIQEFFKKTPAQNVSSADNSRIILYFVFLIFLGWLAASGTKSYKTLDIANSLGGWFWGISLLCFIVGLGGMRITRNFSGTTWSGVHVSGYVDEGAVKGTNGFRGAVALTLSYISVYMVWAMISHWKMGKVFPDGQDVSIVTMVIISALFIIPLFFIFLRIINSNKKAGWIIGGSWLLVLSIVARM